MELKAHKSWLAMRNRCKRTDDGFKDRQYYHDKNITVCSQWQDSFETFLKDMGPATSETHSLERKDGNLGYNPANCCWATLKEQLDNRSSTVWITIGKERKTMTEWGKVNGVSPATISRRLSRGATPEDAIKPIGKYTWKSYRPLTINGVTKHVSEWARELGITPEGLSYRIKIGLKDDELIHGRSVRIMRDLTSDDNPNARGRPTGPSNNTTAE